MITCLLGFLLFVTRVLSCFLFARHLTESRYPYVSAYPPKSDGKYAYSYITLIQNVSERTGYIINQQKHLKVSAEKTVRFERMRLILTNGSLPPSTAALYFYAIAIKQITNK